MMEQAIKWPISVGKNFEEYLLRGKNRESGRFEWEVISRCKIYEGNMDKLADLSGKEL